MKEVDEGEEEKDDDRGKSRCFSHHCTFKICFFCDLRSRICLLSIVGMVDLEQCLFSFDIVP
ncbi:unnamed protein product [Camellia sinensis]